MKQKRVARASIAGIVSVALVITAVPAFAVSSDDSDADCDEAVETAVYDKADYYEEADDNAAADDDSDELELSVQSTSIYPMKLSSDMTYFAKYESGADYAATFSSSDGYHAMGYYQFDNRYGLRDFLIACYDYDNYRYSMFKQFKTKYTEDDFTASDATRKDGEYTTLAKALIAAWEEACEDTEEKGDEQFCLLQNCWAYQEYYEPAAEYLAGRGIDLDDRPDCIKGLCWGLCNLFGTGGWRRFVGGTYAGTTYEGCGLTNKMSDYEFVTTLCNYVVDNVATFYPNSTSYHKGWQNRYKNELQDLYELLGPLSDIASHRWYTEGATYVVDKGIMTGYGSFPYLFGVGDTLTRAQLAVILWRIDDADVLDTYVAKNTKNTTGLTDVQNYRWYTGAVNWAVETGCFSGYMNDDGTYTTFGVDDPVTFEQLCCVLARYAGLSEDTTVGTSVLEKFSDASSISSWATQSMAWIVSKGVVSGYSNGTLVPKEEVARERVAVVLMYSYKKSIIS